MEYEIRALGPGKVITVLVEARNEDDAQRQLAARSLKPLSITRRGHSSLLFRRRPQASFAVLLFSQELVALLEAGLTIVEALEALLEKERGPERRNVLASLLQALREGRSFSVALQGMPEIFPPLYVSIVHAAERTGSLHEALSRYIEYQSRLNAVKAKVLTASIYPAILLVVGAGVSLFLLGYVVPRFSRVYQDAGRDLPPLSSLLMDWGQVVSRHYDAFLLGSLAGLAALAAIVRHLWRSGEILRWLQRLPLVAGLVRTFELARFYLTLGMLLDGGLPIVQCLPPAGELLSPDLRRQVRSATLAIQGGDSISRAFDQHGLSTSIGLRLLRVGERSGNMGPMMARIARHYDAEVSRAIEWFSRMFEPLLMAAIGLVIGGIVVLLYMPIFDLAGTLQ